MIMRMPSLLTTVLAAIRRADETAERQLADVVRLARTTAEPLQMSPVALLQAEAA